MKNKRKMREPSPEGKLNGAPLTHMRGVAYGRDMTVFLHRVEKRQESRDDQFMVDQAEAKRQRKAAKAIANAQKAKS